MSLDRRIGHIEDKLNEARELHAEESDKPPWLVAFEKLSLPDRIAELEQRMVASRAALTPEERDEEDYLAARFSALPIAQQVAVRERNPGGAIQARGAGHPQTSRWSFFVRVQSPPLRAWHAEADAARGAGRTGRGGRGRGGRAAVAIGARSDHTGQF
jgi:hypothetical protein